MDTPSRLRLLSPRGDDHRDRRRRGRRPGVLLPGVLAVPGRGRYRPADPGAADPDQPADRRRDRDQRLPGRRPGAAGAAGRVRPGAEHHRLADRPRPRRPSPPTPRRWPPSTSRSSAYAAAIEQARANNRQGLPVGAQYLRSASTELRSETLPILDSLVRTNAERATDRMEVWIGWVVRHRGAARPGRRGRSARSGWPAGSGAPSTSACWPARLSCWSRWSAGRSRCCS